MKKETIKKVTQAAVNVLLCIFLAISVFAVFFTVFSQKDTDGTAEIFGMQMRIVTSESMAKCELTDTSNFDIKDIPLRSMVFIKTMPKDEAKQAEWYRSLKIGDVLTFRYVYTTQVTITHRIIDIDEPTPGKFIITLAGDNKNAEDGQLTQVIDTSIPNNPNYVIGKVTGQSKVLGAVMSFLHKPVGLVLAIIIPCMVIIVLEGIKIARVFGAEKRQKELEAAQKTQAEIEELRKKLSELEREKELKSKGDEDT